MQGGGVHRLVPVCLGHPIAMIGARMVISPIHELRRRGRGTGVAALCSGGGMAAFVLDVV
jgi:acetyl-CoA C-acetyltransferase